MADYLVPDFEAFWLLGPPLQFSRWVPCLFAKIHRFSPNAIHLRLRQSLHILLCWCCLLVTQVSLFLNIGSVWQSLHCQLYDIMGLKRREGQKLCIVGCFKQKEMNAIHSNHRTPIRLKYIWSIQKKLHYSLFMWHETSDLKNYMGFCFMHISTTFSHEWVCFESSELKPFFLVEPFHPHFLELLLKQRARPDHFGLGKRFPTDDLWLPQNLIWWPFDLVTVL